MQWQVSPDALTGHAARMAAQRAAFLAIPQVRSREEAMRAVIEAALLRDDIADDELGDQLRRALQHPTP